MNSWFGVERPPRPRLGLGACNSTGPPSGDDLSEPECLSPILRRSYPSTPIGRPRKDFSAQRPRASWRRTSEDLASHALEPERRRRYCGACRRPGRKWVLGPLPPRAVSPSRVCDRFLPAWPMSMGKFSVAAWGWHNRPTLPIHLRDRAHDRYNIRSRLSCRSPPPLRRIQFHFEHWRPCRKPIFASYASAVGDHDPFRAPVVRTKRMGSGFGDSLALKFQPISRLLCIRRKQAAFVSSLRSVVWMLLVPTIAAGKPQTIASRWNGDRGDGFELEPTTGCLCLVVWCRWKARDSSRTQTFCLFGNGPFGRRDPRAFAGAFEIHQFSLARDGGRDRSASADSPCPNAFAWPAKTAANSLRGIAGAAGRQTADRHNTTTVRPPAATLRTAPCPPAAFGSRQAATPTAYDPTCLQPGFPVGIAGDRIVDLSATLRWPAPPTSHAAATGANGTAPRCLGMSSLALWRIHFMRTICQDCSWEPHLQSSTIPLELSVRLLCPGS